MADQTALERAQLVVPGDRAELRVDEGRVTIDKEAPTRDAPTSVEFGVDRIRGAQLRTPSRGVRGWLHLSVVGGSPAPPGELAAAGDPYTLPVTGRSVGAARRFARLVDRHVQERGMPRDVDPGGRRRSTGVSIVDEPTPDRPTDARPAAPEPPVEPPTGASDRRGASTPSAAAAFVAELQALADLHANGALSDEEYERAKARVLG